MGTHCKSLNEYKNSWIELTWQIDLYPKMATYHGISICEDTLPYSKLGFLLPFLRDILQLEYTVNEIKISIGEQIKAHKYSTVDFLLFIETVHQTLFYIKHISANFLVMPLRELKEDLQKWDETSLIHDDWINQLIKYVLPDFKINISADLNAMKQLFGINELFELQACIEQLWKIEIEKLHNINH